MNPLLKRILVNGSLTAAILAVVGLGYADLAGLVLASNAPMRASVEAPPADVVDPLADSLQARLPVMMALWGFAFVAVGELVLHRFRRKKPPAEATPDAATILLEQILAKVEAERATLAAIPSPSTAPAENTPVAS